MLIRLLGFWFIFTTLLSAQTIKVAVAANVSYAIDDIKKLFLQKAPESKLRITLGSSGKLVAQIHRGANYDLFMSADMAYPQALYNAALTANKPKRYTQGQLCLFSIKERNFSQGLALLTQKTIKKIAIANPKTAPYGKATLEALRNSKIYKKVKSKLVFTESIAQAISYAMIATDLGIVAKSALLSSKMSEYKKAIHYIDVDSKLYTPISQGMVILKGAKQRKDVKAFYDFILSPQAQKIFHKYGYKAL